MTNLRKNELEDILTKVLEYLPVGHINNISVQAVSGEKKRIELLAWYQDKLMDKWHVSYDLDDRIDIENELYRTGIRTTKDKYGVVFHQPYG